MGDDAPSRWSLRGIPRAVLVRRTVVVLACLVFAAVCFWEALAPADCGHFCSTAEVAIGGTNMWRFRIFAAVSTLVRSTPGPELHYTHHPYGVFLSAAFFTRIFGTGLFGMRASGMFTGALSAPLVYLVARRLASPAAAALGTVLFVLLPIDLAFARFGSLEGVTIFWGLVYCWGTLEFFRTWRLPHLLVAAAGAIGASQADWIGAIFVGLVTLPAFVRGYLVPSRLGDRTDVRRFSLWFVVSVVGVLSALLYIVIFARENRLSDLVGSYGSRSAGAELPLGAALSPRRLMWIRWTLPLHVLWLAPAGAAISALHLLRGKREHAVVVAWFIMASMQYFLFKQGADVHVFWPHYYGVCVGLGGAVVASTVLSAYARVAPRLRGWMKRTLVAAALLVVSAQCALLARQGFAQLWQARITSGRLDEAGNFIDSLREHVVFARWAYAGLPASYDIAVHGSVPETPNLSYSLQRPTRHAELTPVGPSDPGRYAIVDLRNVDTTQAKTIATTFPMVVAGPFARVDRAGTPAAPDAVSYTLRAPTLFERMFVQATEPTVVIGADEDPFATWELRAWLGVPEAPLALPAPTNAEEARIAHNERLAAGAGGAAPALAERAKGGFDAPAGGPVAFSNGVSLVGVKVERLGGSVATFLFSTDATFKPFHGDFTVTSRVVAAPLFWEGGTDFHFRDVAPRGSIRPDTWKPGGLYAMRFKVLPRIGREEFTGGFTGSEAPQPLTARRSVLFVTGP
jgi:hypothetical protein